MSLRSIMDHHRNSRHISRRKRRICLCLASIWFLICSRYWRQRTNMKRISSSLRANLNSVQPLGVSQPPNNHTLIKNQTQTKLPGDSPDTFSSPSENATTDAYRVNISNITTRNPERTTHGLVLMGQFNFDAPFDSVRNWVQIWSNYFTQIVVAGPFSVETQMKLESARIKFKVGMDDLGFVSPYENLLNTMIDYQQGASSDRRPEGVLYLHDDALLSIPILYKGRASLPTDVIIKSPIDDPVIEKRMRYSIHVERERRRWPNGTEFSKVLPTFLFEHTPTDDSTDNTMHRSFVDLAGVLIEWDHWNMTLPQQVKMLSEYAEWWEDFSDYSKDTTMISTTSTTDSNETALNPDQNQTSELLSRTAYRFSFPGISQADFLYIPLQYTEVLEQAARPHIQSSVFLEVAIPTIVQWMVKKIAQDPAPLVPVPTIEGLSLCTDWDYKTRGSQKMLRRCMGESTTDWGMYHPLKLGQVGPKAFSDWLTRFQKSPQN